MSYCRFAWDGSDVYVFESMDGLTCCGCHLLEDGFICKEPEEMIAHLGAHRRAGSFVPEHAITSLFDDIPGALRPSKPEPRSLTVTSLVMDLCCTENELLRQYEKLSDEEKKSHPLPVGLKKRLRDLKTALKGFEVERLKRVAALKQRRKRTRSATR